MGDLVELPSHWACDDWPPYVQSMDLDYMMQFLSPDRAMEVFMAEFEAQWECKGSGSASGIRSYRDDWRVGCGSRR